MYVGFKEKPLKEDAEEAAVQRLCDLTGPGKRCPGTLATTLSSPELIDYRTLVVSQDPNADFSTGLQQPPPIYVILDASFSPLSIHLTPLSPKV